MTGVEYRKSEDGSVESFVDGESIGVFNSVEGAQRWTHYFLQGIPVAAQATERFTEAR